MLPLCESDRDFERWLSLYAAEALWKVSADRKQAAEVASKLLDDDHLWIVFEAIDLLIRAEPGSPVASAWLKEFSGDDERGLLGAREEVLWQFGENVSPMSADLAEEVLKSIERSRSGDPLN